MSSNNLQFGYFEMTTLAFSLALPMLVYVCISFINVLCTLSVLKYISRLSKCLVKAVFDNFHSFVSISLAV